MFLLNKKGLLDICLGEKSLFCDVSLSIAVENGKKYNLKPTSLGDNSVCFESDEAKAELFIVGEGNNTALCIKGGLIRDRSKNQYFDNAKNNLSKVCGIVVHIGSINGMKQYNSIMLKTFWVSPGTHGTDISKLMNLTQAFSMEFEKDFGVMMSVCDKQYKSFFRGCENGGFDICLTSYKSGMTEFESTAFIFGRNKNPFVISDSIAEYGLKLMDKPGKPAKDRRYPEILEYLGWCSWDAFPCAPTHDGLVEKVKEFKEKHIPVKWAIIDDMWQQLDGEDNTDVMHDRKLVSIEADSKKFPKGLKAAVSNLKSEGLKVGIWHPLEGYWFGFDENSELVRTNPDIFCKTEDGRTVIKPTETAIFRYHNMFYEYLKKCGADFVKVDCQSSIEWFYRNMGTVGEMAHNIHEGIEGAVGAHFDGDMINCMGCASENIWNRPNSLVNRCSNDFQPENRKWFIQHILQASYCCYYYSGFFKGDFDMFWTDDEQAVKNCVVRAMSGGPVYVSDKVGRSVSERLMPLVFSDGKIVRCNNSAVPTADCLMDNCGQGEKAFKIWNKTDNGLVIAAFNLTDNETPVIANISPNDTMDATGSYIAYDYFSGETIKLSSDDSMKYTLNNYDDFKFFNFAPIKNGRAVIGITEKYITTGTFREFLPGKFEVQNGGSFAFYSETMPDKIMLDGAEVSAQNKNNVYIVNIAEIDKKHILEIY